MAAIKKPKYSKSEVSQRFNLKSLLGYEPSDRQKQLFYELAVEKMVDRTTRGKDIDNKKFTRYSKEYAEKKGVARDAVDLVLEGDMLSSFEESQKQKNVVKIKIEEGKETLKAYNHNVGDTLPQRTFFGFKNENQVKDIVKEVDSIRSERPSLLDGVSDLAALRQAVEETIDIGFEDFDGES